MKLSLENWIFVFGRLYSPPFASRFLFYRLLDLDCSVLVYHEETSTAVTREQPGTHLCEVAVKEPEKFFVQYATSANARLPEFAALPSEELPLPLERSAEHRIGPVHLRLTPYKVPGKQMLIPEYPATTVFEHAIENTDFSISGPALRAPKELVGLPDESLALFWGVTLTNTATNKAYNLASTQNWTLAAQTSEDSLSHLRFRFEMKAKS
jgi:hypothetical protein